MVPLGSEILFHLQKFAVTNTVTATLLTDVVLLTLVFLVYKSLSLRPGKLQSMFEMLIDYFYNMTEQVAGSRAKGIFPWFCSFFLFIFAANFLALLPGYGLLTIMEHGGEAIPLLRAPSSDLNTTLALAVVSVAATHILCIKYAGFKHYLFHFFPLSPMIFIGVLEFVLEAAKLISFSFRLFGNIFAGEIVIGRMSAISAFIVPLPFMTLELIVAVVQAVVFAMLTMVFMSILSQKEHA